MWGFMRLVYGCLLMETGLWWLFHGGWFVVAGQWRSVYIAVYVAGLWWLVDGDWFVVACSWWSVYGGWLMWVCLCGDLCGWFIVSC